MISRDDQSRIDRREALKWVASASASIYALDVRVFGRPVPGARAADGYGTDPVLNKTWKPGDLWPLTFDAAQRRAATALCDVILPADDRSPSASAVGVPDFIDEWISAPYPRQQADRETVIAGLAWLAAESNRRYSKDFADLSTPQQRAICDDVCYLPDAKPELEPGARFFATFRNLTAGAFYATPEGMKDVGYVGNVALSSFDGPPEEVLDKLGLR